MSDSAATGTRSRGLTGLAIALVAATGCALGQSVGGVSPSGAVPWAATAPTRHVHSDSITLWLFAPTEVRWAEPVPMRVELENTGGWIQVTLAGRAPHADFIITTASGQEVWSVYRDVDRLANADHRRLDHRERIVFPFEWGQETRSPGRPGPRVAPGSYFLHARVRLGGQTVETARRPLRIVR
jgi:hypothetical protein